MEIVFDLPIGFFLIDNIISQALAYYDKWVSTYLSKAHTKENDTVMTQLKAAPANDTDGAVVLGFKDVPSCTDVLKKALASPGSAIAQERAHQLAETLGFFPSSSLMSAAEEILGRSRRNLQLWCIL